MNDREKIEAAKEWWSDNCMKPWADWDAMMVLGGILKDDPEPEVDYSEEIELNRQQAAMSTPIVWVDPRVAESVPRKKLDPMPYVQFYGTAHEERFSQNDPMRIYGTFHPRPGFEQDKTKYYEFGRRR